MPLYISNLSKDCNAGLEKENMASQNKPTPSNEIISAAPRKHGQIRKLATLCRRTDQQRAGRALLYHSHIPLETSWQRCLPGNPHPGTGQGAKFPRKTPRPFRAPRRCRAHLQPPRSRPAPRAPAKLIAPGLSSSPRSLRAALRGRASYAETAGTAGRAAVQALRLRRGCISGERSVRGRSLLFPYCML